jgi:hypothetical protein
MAMIYFCDAAGNAFVRSLPFYWLSWAFALDPDGHHIEAVCNG